MPDEPIQSPADKQQPKKVDLPIAGKIVDVKGKDGLDAKKEGNEIKLSFELPVQTDVVPEATPEIPTDIASTNQPTPVASPTESQSANVDEQQQNKPTDDTASTQPSPAELPPTTPTPSSPNPKPVNPAPASDNPAVSNAPATPSTQPSNTQDVQNPTTKNQNSPGNKKPSFLEKLVGPQEERVNKNGDWKLPDRTQELTDSRSSPSANSAPTNTPSQKSGGVDTPTQPTPTATPAAGQPPKTGDTQLNPKQQRAAGQDLKKQSLRQRASNLKTNASNVAKDPKQAAKNFRNKLGDNVKTGAKNKGKEIANSLQTSKMRRRKLLKEADEISKQISELQGTMRGLKASRELRILKFFFPSLYNKIAGISETTGDISQKIKVSRLESQIATLRTAKISLETAQGAAAVLDAIMTTVRLAAGLIETVIGTIAVILLSPIIVLVLAMIYFVVGGKFSQAIKDLVIKINKILEPLEKTLGVEKKKLNLTEQRKEKREEIKNIEAEEKQEKQQAQQTVQENQTADRTLPAPINTHTPSPATTPSATPEAE